MTDYICTTCDRRAEKDADADGLQCATGGCRGWMVKERSHAAQVAAHTRQTPVVTDGGQLGFPLP